MSETATATEITVGSVVVITEGSANPTTGEAWKGLTATVVSVDRYSDPTVTDQAYIRLTEGLSRPDGSSNTMGFYWPLSKLALATTEASESNADATEETPAVTYAEGEIVHVTELYMGEALTEPYLAEYIRPYPHNNGYGRNYYAHTVRMVDSGARHDVGAVEKVTSVATILRTMAEGKKSAEAQVQSITATKEAEFAAWKIGASIEAMRVALDNNMCTQTEKAMHAAGMPTMVTADVTMTLRLDIPVREYIKADAQIDDEGDPSSDQYIIARTAYMLAAVTGVAGYKWEERIASVGGVTISEIQRDHDEDNCKCGYCD